MNRKKSPLFQQDIPLSFTDGTKIYKQFTSQYIQHKRGFFILAPSGSGKTHYVKNQKELHWIDGDTLWTQTNAHPKGEWWLEPLETIFEIDQRCDVITVQAKKLGLWIMGASNFWLKPDAIVLPHWSTHKKYIRLRETGMYDGGAKSDALEQVKGHRRAILQWTKQGVPKFTSISKAVDFLSRSI